MTYQHCNRLVLDRVVSELAEATVSTRELDARIARAFGAEADIAGKLGWKMRLVPWYDYGEPGPHWQNLSRFSSDVNDAFSLARYVMPGLELRVHMLPANGLPRHHPALWSIRSAEDPMDGLALIVDAELPKPRRPAIAIMYALARMQQLALQGDD